MPPKLYTLDKKGKGTPNLSHRSSSIAPPGKLLPLRNPTAAGATGAVSPAVRKAALKQQLNVASQKKLNTPEVAIRALRQDLLQVQQLIDGKTSRSILNYNQRKLEADILRLQEQNSETPEQEIVDLLNLLSSKCGEAGEVMGPAAGARGNSPTRPSQASSLPLSGGGMPPPPGSITAASAQPVSVVRNLLDLLKALSPAHIPQQQQTQALLLSDGGSQVGTDAAGGPSSRGVSPDNFETVLGGNTVDAVGGGGFFSSDAIVDDSKRSVADGEGNLPPRSGGGSRASSIYSGTANGSQIRLGSNMPRSSMNALRNHQQAVTLNPPVAAANRMAPMSAGSLAQLQAVVGLDIPTVENQSDGSSSFPEQQIDTEFIVKQLVTAARRVKNLQDTLDHRMNVSNEVGDCRQTQSRLELEANQSVLSSAQYEIDELKKIIATSRFGPNKTKSLATARDAPMSFQVEQQYQRDITRSKLRVQELEEKYQKLWDSGLKDRDDVGRLSNEVAHLKAVIEGIEKEKRSLLADRNEQVALFQGASQARGEEARMSLTAVKQLESRVSELTDNLRHEKRCKEMLAENLKHVFVDYNKAERLLQQGRNRVECTTETFNDYKQYYNHETLETVARLQGQLRRASHSSDEKEAMITLQKQQLEDNEVRWNLTQGELSAFMDRLKASTEWKMINVRAADEARQLGMRLVGLITDREKKEAGMAAQHADRLEMYKARAEDEIREREERRNHDIQPIDCESIDAEYKGKYAKRQQVLEKIQLSSKPMERIKTALRLKDEYLAECMVRVVTFSTFFEEKYPSED